MENLAAQLAARMKEVQEVKAEVESAIRTAKEEMAEQVRAKNEEVEQVKAQLGTHTEELTKIQNDRQSLQDQLAQKTTELANTAA